MPHNRSISSLCLAFVLLWLSTPAFTAEHLKLANTNTLLTGLIRLADDQDLYTQFGIQLELEAKDTGEVAIRSLINKQADLAVVAGAPFVKHALNHPNLRLIATIGQCDNEIKLAVRKDRGIAGPEDLRGKRIGTQPGVAFHLFLDRLLIKHGMTEQDITPVFMPADRLPAALANGLIDVMSSREPYLSQALELQENNIRIISAPGIYIKSFHLVTTDEFLQTDRAKSLIPLLQALNEAERRLTHQPDEMTALLSKQLEQTPDEVKHQLHESRLRLSMDSHLLSSLETIARWLQPIQGGADETSIDFLPYLHTPLLATVKPNSVHLLH
ncbi:MAG: ABC transporter substrate-binding protein [Pseudomonadota bacterium]